MPADFFFRHNLELSFRLLRSRYPLLAQSLKQALDELQPAASEGGRELLHNRELVAKLSPQVIGKIVSSLTYMGRNALRAQDLPDSHLALLNTLIKDWMQLTEWLLQYASADNSDQTQYH